MTKNGHNMVGLCCSWGSFAFPHEHPWFLMLGIWLGATAPDWLEMAWYDFEKKRRMSIIEHRTWTHWLLPWIALLAGSYHLASQDTGYWILFGFAVGGIAHLVVDIPNPTGVPIWGPFRRNRKSLKWWKSREMEIPIVFVFGMTATILHHWTGNGLFQWIQNTSEMVQKLQ